MEHLVTELSAFADGVLQELGLALEQTDELERQVTAAFCFGGVNVLVHRDGLTPPDAHALMLALLIRKFAYSPEQAAAFAEDLIQATAPDAHPVLNAIIHRGIDGHAQYEGGDRDGLRRNITEIMTAVQKG